MKHTLVIVGAGLAGLSAALTAVKNGWTVKLVSSLASERAQSVMAEGGINAALNTKGEEDSPEQHYTDTLTAACGLADPNAVCGMTQAASELVRSLHHLGVQFNVTDDDELVIKYQATTNKLTIVNLTHHAFFSIQGIANPTPTIDNIICQVNAEFYLPIDEVSIPTGEILKVEGTPFDFRTPKTIGQDIDADHEQIKNGQGFDHNYVLNHPGTFRKAAEADLPEEFLDAGSIREDAQPAAGKKAAAEQASLPLAQPARSGRATSQMSLLDAMPQESAPALDDVSALPDCGDARVALIWAHGDREAPYLAVEGADGSSLGEWQWKGPVAELARWLAPARTLVTADLKGLLTSAPCWQFLAGRAGGCIDLGVAAYLLNPEENDYGWPRLSARWGAVLRHELESRGETAPGPARLGLAMAQLFEQRMEKDGLLELFRQLEMPLLPVLAGMEQSGVAIDAAAFRAFLDDVQGRLDQLTAHVYELAGTQFNIRSAQQLGDVLFNGLGLPAPRKTKGGQASTSQQTLEKLAGQHPVVDSILQYRKLEKMRSTYLDPLPRLVDPQGRIHTTFNQKATATGRLSSSNPNLQNIPVRGPLGKRMRSCFIAGPGRLLVSADYSQVELRVLAHVSQDPALLEAFRNGEDIHARTAALVYDLPPDQVNPDQRRNAKTINFGLIYGMGAQKLAQELKISTTQAKDFIARYFERLQGLKEFYEGVEASARKHGFVTTLGGRRRLLPDINSASGQAAALARRQAINTVIQGSAADIIKLAMLAVARDEHLRELDARLLLQVHDELLLEVPADAAEEAGALVARLMQDVCPAGKELSVPLLVDWGTGHDWGAAH